MPAQRSATKATTTKARSNGKVLRAVPAHPRDEERHAKPATPEFHVDSLPIGDPSDVRDLGDGIFWVGVDTQDAFRCNPYVIVDGDEAVLYSAASYAPYVIGDEQAPIHQKRWLTAVQAARIVAQRGELDQIVRNTLEGMQL